MLAGRAFHLPAAPSRGDRAVSQGLVQGQAEHYDEEENHDLIRRYCEALEDSRQNYDGITVRYEELTEDPARETKRICEFLGVDWEPSMLDYGKKEHGRYKSGLGDWSDKIKSGEVQKAEAAAARDAAAAAPDRGEVGLPDRGQPGRPGVLKFLEELVPHRADRVHLEVAPGLARASAAAVT